ncbi:nickel/cobalt transporter [Streptomyces sp. NPDC055749]
MNQYLRRAVPGAAATLLLCAAAVASAPAAAAHPLGNFTVNHSTGLTLHPGRVDAVVVVDRAEIAAAQERTLVDRDHDGTVSKGEAGAYARGSCATLAGQLRVTAEGSPLSWKHSGSTLTYHPGEAGLKTSRLQCGLTAEADLRRPTDIEVRTAYDSRRVGWREVTARAVGIALTGSDVPTSSTTDQLRRYPDDPLSAPLDQRTASLRVEAGPGSAASAVRDALPRSGPVGEALAKVSGTFGSLVGTRELTVPIGLLALLLAAVLGASHAALPGHGKTIMAAYLAGRRGTPRDAVTVGATVTVTHTAGVLALGLILPLATHLAGETVLTWLGMASGLLVTAIGLWLLRSALLNRPAHGHHHGHTHHHGHGHGHHGHDHDHHDHDHHHGDGTRLPGQDGHEQEGEGSVALLTKGHDHPHSPPEQGPSAGSPQRATRGGLIGMGIAGGLVPSPSALVVLLGAVALGRTAFGVLLVIAYGLGMAGTLTLAGLILVRLRDRIEAGARAGAITRWGPLRRLARLGPVATSSLVLVVGVGLTVRAAVAPW